MKSITKVRFALINSTFIQGVKANPNRISEPVSIFEPEPKLNVKK